MHAKVCKYIFIHAGTQNLFATNYLAAVVFTESNAALQVLHMHTVHMNYPTGLEQNNSDYS